MNIDFQIRDDSGYTLVELAGRLDSANSYPLQNAFDELIAQKPTKLIIDFSSVNFLSSRSLWVVIEVYRQFPTAFYCEPDGVFVKHAAKIFFEIEFHRTLEAARQEVDEKLRLSKSS